MKDYSTKNESFLKVHKLLKEKGIKNNDFMLELKDKSLLGIDTQDPNLSKEIKNKIKKECEENIWYYFREYLMVHLPAGGSTHFQLSSLTSAMIYLFNKGRNQYVIAHRQSYKSHTADYLCEYGMNKNKLSIHFKDIEFTRAFSDISKVYDRYNKSQYIIIMESVISDEDRGQTKLLETASNWNDSLYDIETTELSDFYYVYYNYTELVENPEEFLNKMSRMLCNDEDMIRREILCKRK